MDTRIVAALENISETKRRIINARMELQELREVAGSAPGGSADPERGGGGNGDRTSTMAIKIITLEKEIRNLENIYCDYMDQLTGKIQTLPSKECHVLTMRFIGHRKPKEIADELGYSERQMFRIYNQATKHLADLMDNGQTCQ